MLQRTVTAAVGMVLVAVFAARANDEVDAFIKTQLHSQNIPALALAVVKDGKVLKAQGYGLADRERRIPATAETVFLIASVSKQFVASGIVLLVQEGKVGLDDPISTYLEGTPPAWRPITIRHVLTHTSGILREPPGYDASKIQTDADVIRSAYGQPLRFAPGTKWEYSNTGYFALAEIIRKAAGMPWTEYLNAKIFAPLGMTHTHPTNTKATIPNRAVGYTDNDQLRKTDAVAALRPSGAYISTVLDMARWDAALNTDRILSDASRTQMWTPVRLADGSSFPYGFGWQVDTVNGRRQVHHGGGGPGVRSKFARFIDDRLSIIVLTNLDDVDVDSIVGGVANIYLR